MYLVQAVLPFLSNKQQSKQAHCQRVFSSTQKGIKKGRQKPSRIQSFCATPLTAPWYVGEVLSDKTTSLVRLREKMGEDERRGETDRERMGLETL